MPIGGYLPVEPKYLARLPYGSPTGQEWVRAGRDLYLMSKATGTVIELVHDWLRQFGQLRVAYDGKTAWVSGVVVAKPGLGFDIQRGVSSLG